MKVRKAYGEIFLLPSLFTLSNLFCGFLSILMTFHGRYRLAAFLIIIAAILDAMDGIVARMTDAGSDFGIQLDSLSDTVSFGAATAFLLYFWGLKNLQTLGLVVSFLFLAAGVIRLARYNIRTKAQPDRRTYQGLTVPSASLFLASVVIFLPASLSSRWEALPMSGLTLFLSLCMVSAIPYKNYLNINFRRKISARSVLFMAVILGGLVFYHKVFLLVFFGMNALSGPFQALIRMLKKKRKAEGPAAVNSVE
jgi:CDP-diacylglycerol---serine O-phosphatidyltransferase